MTKMSTQSPTHSKSPLGQSAGGECGNRVTENLELLRCAVFALYDHSS